MEKTSFMKTRLRRQEPNYFLSLLQRGDERGLEYFYKRHYRYLAARALRATGDDCTADSIAQEALLRLWLVRDRIADLDSVLMFLVTQVRAAVDAFYRTTRNRFQRSLLRLDSIEDYQDFMCGYELEDEEEEDTAYLDEREAEARRNLEKINTLLPHLDDQLQLFITLCLKYNFSYERVAYHLGGISDYEVAMRVERSIATLRAALADTSKLDQATRTKPKMTEGALTDAQEKVLSMRYELQYSFEEIAQALKLGDEEVKELFVQAHATIRKRKKSA